MIINMNKKQFLGTFLCQELTQLMRKAGQSELNITITQDELFYAYENYVKTHAPLHDFTLTDAFVWSKSPQGDSYWCHVYKEFYAGT